MPESEDEMITFRISPRDRAAIARLIEQGEFRNRSDFLRYAVRSALDNVQRTSGARASLDLEGVELPPQGGAHAAGARPRRPATRKGVGL